MHVPVLIHECLEALKIQPDGVYVDATYGGGGHSAEILKLLGEKGRLIAFDQDEAAKERVLGDKRITFVNENFRHLVRFLRLNGIKKVDGILADLGMSSFQLDSEERGFSTRFDAPLDMRMDQSKSKTAAQILNQYSAKELQRVFQEYGEVRNARSLSETISGAARNGVFQNTSDFIAAIQPMIRGNRNRYLAQVFQALRIEVNEEMDALKEFLTGCTELIRPDGRIAIITFHSLEDRLVKRYFKTGSFDGEIVKDVFGNYEKPLNEVNRKPIVPTEQEIKSNKRSRSAKLRIATK